MMHLYHLTLRPPSIGCYPDRDNAGQPLVPVITASYWPPRRVDNHNLYGTVGYPAPLEFDRIWRYDLTPDDAVERARYGFWEYYRGETYDYLAEWLAQPRADLEALAQRDVLAQWALTLLDAGGSQP
jgi:hypothetical protein